MEMVCNFPAGKQSHILVVDGLITEKFCSSFIAKALSIWDTASYAGETIDGVIPLTKATQDMGLSQRSFTNKNIQWNEEWQKFEDGFLDGIHTAISYYIAEYPQLQMWSAISDTGFQVQRYKRNNGYYRAHVDSFPTDNGSAVERVAAVILYLNTVEIGGQTSFPQHDTMVQPVAGRIVVFPAAWTHLHEARPPFSEDKWIISTFLVNRTVDNHDHEHLDNEIRDESGNVPTRPLAQHISIVTGEKMEDALSPYNPDFVEFSGSVGHGASHGCVQCANRESHDCKYDDHAH